MEDCLLRVHLALQGGGPCGAQGHERLGLELRVRARVPADHSEAMSSSISMAMLM